MVCSAHRILIFDKGALDYEATQNDLIAKGGI